MSTEMTDIAGELVAGPARGEGAGTAAALEAATEETRCPGIFDTYALVYAFTLMFLVPGALTVGNLPFRTYTVPYVSLVTVPFVLGIVATLITDNTDAPKTVLRRILILTPLIVVTGVAVMFLSVIFMVPINMFLGPAYRELMTPIAGAAGLAVASPLVIALIRRIRMRLTIRGAVQALALTLSLIAAGYLFYLAVFQVGELGAIAKSARKDVVIYIVGALVWYMPSFGLAAGLWRRVGLL